VDGSDGREVGKEGEKGERGGKRQEWRAGEDWMGGDWPMFLIVLIKVANFIIMIETHDN